MLVLLVLLELPPPRPPTPTTPMAPLAPPILAIPLDRPTIPAPLPPWVLGARRGPGGIRA